MVGQDSDRTVYDLCFEEYFDMARTVPAASMIEIMVLFFATLNLD